MNAPSVDLNVLAEAWGQARAEEQAANARRLQIEAAIVALVKDAPEEGTSRLATDTVKVSIGFKVTRTVDTEALREQWDTLSENEQSAFRWKADLDLKKLRALQDLMPQSYAQAARFITSKPAKPSVSIEPLEKK